MSDFRTLLGCTSEREDGCWWPLFLASLFSYVSVRRVGRQLMTVFLGYGNQPFWGVFGV
jgi:hypothetical protein